MSSISYISSQVSSASTAASTSTTTSSTSLSSDKEAFLQLLLTQLENQNPLDPVDTTEYTSQLVSYSQLEQQMNTNDKLDSLVSALSNSSSFSVFSYLGTDVGIDSNASSMQSGKADWTYTIDDAATDVNITVKNAAGETIGTYAAGDAEAGTYAFSIENSELGTSLDEGTPLYLTVTATDENGDTVTTSTAGKVKVTAVESNNGTTTLSAGDLEFDSGIITSMRQEAA